MEDVNCTDLVYNLLKNDSELKVIQGLKIIPAQDRIPLSDIPERTNKRILIYEQRTGKQEWSGERCHQQRNLIIEVAARVVAAANIKTPASSDLRALLSRIREVMAEATFYGTGWLWHDEGPGQAPRVPVQNLSLIHI